MCKLLRQNFGLFLGQVSGVYTMTDDESYHKSRDSLTLRKNKKQQLPKRERSKVRMIKRRFEQRDQDESRSYFQEFSDKDSN